MSHAPTRPGKTRALTRPLATLLTLTISTTSLWTTGCASVPVDETESSESTSEALRTPFDGETVFRGVMLGQGPVARKLPTLWGSARPNVERENPRGDALRLADKVDELARSVCDDGCSAATRSGLRSAAARLRSGEQDRIVQSSADLVARATGPAADAATHALLALIQKQEPTFFRRFGATMQSGNPVKIREGLAEALRVTTAAADTLDKISRGELKVDGLSIPNLNPYEELDGPVLLVIVIAIAVVLVLTIGNDPRGGLRQDLVVRELSSQLAVRSL